MPSGITKVTLTASQEEYVRANHTRMSTGEMGRNLDVTQNKIWENLRFMYENGILERPAPKKVKPVINLVKDGFFDEKAYAKSLMY